jgi:hypothetical protein
MWEYTIIGYWWSWKAKQSTIFIYLGVIAEATIIGRRTRG